jgi:uncharacterized iron-regulated protein
MTMRRTILFASLAAALIAGGSPARDQTIAPALPDLTSYVLMRSDGGTPVAITVNQAADALKDYDVIVFGEFHDHAGNHLAEMALFSAIYARAPNVALSLEQFERDVQNVLDDYMAGRIGEEALKKNARAWPNYDEAYRPLVEYAKEHRLSVIAAETPTSIVRCVGQEGPEYLARLGADKRGWAAAELHLGEGAYKDKFMHFLADDPLHGSDASQTPAERAAADARSFAAQATRDDTMAESIFLHLQKNPGGKIVHVTGNFHVEAFLGTVERLKLRAPSLKIAVVAPVEIENPASPSLTAADAGSGNFLVLLRALPKSYLNDVEMKAATAGMNFRARRAPCGP